METSHASRHSSAHTFHPGSDGSLLALSIREEVLRDKVCRQCLDAAVAVCSFTREDYQWGSGDKERRGGQVRIPEHMKNIYRGGTLVGTHHIHLQWETAVKKVCLKLVCTCLKDYFFLSLQDVIHVMANSSLRPFHCVLTCFRRIVQPHTLRKH